MKPAVFRAAALTLSLCLLAGCARTARREVSIPHAETPGAVSTPAPSDSAAGSLQEVYGSCGLLAWPSVLYSIYLQDTESRWTQEAMAQTRESLAVAVSWIAEQAQSYNASPKISYDNGENGLYTVVDCTSTLTEQTTGDSAFYDYVDTLTAAVDTEAIQSAFGTASIGYLIFLPVEGSAYSILHYIEDGSSYLNEFSCLYLYDPYSAPGTYDSPAVYAHEILHLFGAADLYADSTDAFVTQPLAQYVVNTWPDAIMYDTYNSDGSICYDRIEKSICPLTAYRLGLTDTFPGIEQFPDAAADPPGTFSDGTEDAWAGGGADAA